MARLIDSSVFIELERRGQPLALLASDARSEPIAMASISVSELLLGMEKANTLSRRRDRSAFVEGVLATIPVFALDIAVARAHARIWAELERTGNRIGPYDLIVAATALVHGYDVLTFNDRGFERVSGLVVIRPSW